MRLEELKLLERCKIIQVGGVCWVLVRRVLVCSLSLLDDDHVDDNDDDDGGDDDVDALLTSLNAPQVYSPARGIQCILCKINLILKFLCNSIYKLIE